MTDRDDDESGTGLRFTLPPITLPEITFPERFVLLGVAPEPPRARLRVRVRTRNVLLAVAVLDVLDATVAVAVTSADANVARIALGTVVSLVVANVAGVAYLWEGVAVAVGVGWLTVVPTATLLALARLLR